MNPISSEGHRRHRRLHYHEVIPEITRRGRAVRRRRGPRRRRWRRRRWRRRWQRRRRGERGGGRGWRVGLLGSSGGGERVAHCPDATSSSSARRTSSLPQPRPARRAISATRGQTTPVDTGSPKRCWRCSSAARSPSMSSSRLGASVGKNTSGSADRSRVLSFVPGFSFDVAESDGGRRR